MMIHFQKEKQMPDFNTAKTALDLIIKKSRVHLYKPIQIAEILHRDRVYGDINILDLDTYRTKSKRWRDEISQVILGTVCSSSSRFQDNLFDNNAMPPILLNELAKKNKNTNGAVEAYIYAQFTNRHSQLSNALNVCLAATRTDFNVKNLLDSFWEEPGLRRSIDKIYEIVVYSLFSVLVDCMGLQVEISIDETKIDLLNEFEDFADKVMCLNSSNTTYVQNAKVFRVGITNAADRGLDMYSNWGPAIQIKHLSLNVELAQNIVSSVASDRIVIVCKDAERDIILSLLTQIGWKAHIQSIVTENELVDWYEKACRGTYSAILGDKLLQTLSSEIMKEFPSVLNTEYPDILKDRHYENLDVSQLL